jgi:hypothetical protein
MKADIPAAIPASIVNAKAGRVAISANIVSPAGVDLYNEFVNDVPMINKIGIATMRPIDHLPNIVFGTILQGRFVIPSSLFDLSILHAACLVLIFLANFLSLFMTRIDSKNVH